MLTEFKVEGPSNPTVGDTLTVSFTLTCNIPPSYPLGPKGVYAAVRDADNTIRDFGSLRAGQSLKAGDVITFSASLVVDEQGTWKIWPSYQINMPTGMKTGPDYWHSANITIGAPLRPDLVVLDVLSDPANSRVGFTVANTGNATAPSSFSVRLLVNQQTAFSEVVPQGLAAGAQYSSWFYGYVWPQNVNITVTVTADFYNAEAESNEGNNALTETLTRQVETLGITQGPSVSVVDQDTVVVHWLTNLDSNSSVNYGTTALPDRSQGNSTYTQSHYVTLDKLNPGTTYSFFVSSWDSIGQRAISKQFTFETPPPSDGKAPSLLVPLAGNLTGIVNVTAQAEDESGVDRLLFYIEGVLKFTDYSPPFFWLLNTTEYPDGSYNITVLAIDRAGNPTTRMVVPFIDNPEGDARPPVVSILSPGQGETVWGSVRIEALAVDVGLAGEITGYIQRAQMLIDGVVAKTWVYTPFQFNPLTGEMEVNPRSSSLTMVHFWNATSLTPGSNHTVEVRAWDNSSNMGSSTANVSILKIMGYTPPAELHIVRVELSRSVVRIGNWFEVTLSLRNAGTVELEGLSIIDECVGFQIVSLPMPATSPDEVDYSVDRKESGIHFRNPSGVLEGGETWTVSYYAVPILYEPSEGFTDSMYQIGNWAIYHVSDPYIMEEVETPYAPALGDEDRNGVNDLEDAFRSADYLIVTNPGRLFDFNSWDPDGVNLLLQDAATLAEAKNGVLGYLSTINCACDLRALIVPGGGWADRLGDCFDDPNAANAFLLLIGKSEVVPAYTYDISGWDITWSDGDHTEECRLSDNYYADTVHNDGRPDLVVGRIVGNIARELILPIEASLEVFMGHGIARDQALVVSGYEDRGSDEFVETVENMGEDLASKGLSCAVIHFSMLIETAWTVHFDEGDVFVLADVDGDGLDEAVIGRDEDDMAYMYECYPRSLIGSFSCPITPNDGFTAGDYDGDGRDEIAVAHNGDGQDGRIYIYKANGTMIGYWDEPFHDWDLIASGDLYNRYGESRPRDEVVIGYCDWDRVHAYSLYFDTSSGQWMLYQELFNLGIDLTRYDAMAVGNLRNDLDRDELAIVRDDNSHAYVYDIYGTYGIDGTSMQELSNLDSKSGNDVRYTKYDGFAAGDVNNDTEDELVVLCDEDDRMYAYHWNGSAWQWYPLYSQYWNYWFNGVYDTGGSDRHDGFGVGRFSLTEPALMVVLLNDFGDTSSFQTFAASWPEAERLANERIQAPSVDISIMAVMGHGNPRGASPIGTAYMDLWNFANHPTVIAYSCLAGYYGTTPDYTLGDALFARGAAAFIGSTEVSAIHTNQGVATSFFQSHWDIGSELPAVALRDWERSHFSGGYSKLFVYEYNFYGDPKFGG